MEEIYRRYSKMIYGFLFSKCADATLAEELTQETFYQALRSIDSFRGESNVSTWLCGIALHVWQNHLRKHSKSQNDIPLDSLPESYTHGNDNNSTEQIYISKMETLELLQALHNIDEPFREVLYLRLMGDLSFKEIGQIMQQSENWARVNFYRGKEKLKRGFLINEQKCNRYK